MTDFQFNMLMCHLDLLIAVLACKYSGGLCFILSCAGVVWLRYAMLAL